MVAEIIRVFVPNFDDALNSVLNSIPTDPAEKEAPIFPPIADSTSVEEVKSVKKSIPK